MKKYLLVMIALLLAGSALGGLWASSRNTEITVTAIGTAAVGDSVVAWTVGRPSFSPVQGAVGVIDSSFDDGDGDSGGLATIKVPASPPSLYRVTIFLADPDENVQAYSFFNMGIKVVAAVSPERNLLGQRAALFASSLSVVDHDGDGIKEASDIQFLNAEKGFISFFINSVDGTLVDSDNRLADPGSGNEPDARAFNIGIQSATFFTKDTSSSDNLSPEFTIEVDQS